MRLEEWAGTLYFVMLVITTCTNRKRQPIAAKLHVASLPYADRDKLVAEWTRRLACEKALRPVTDLYAGRGFQEAVLAARRLGAELFVASAGLGLVRESATVPSYACTILANAHDSIADRVGEGFSAAAWWRQINQASPFAVSLAASVASSRGLVCAALSESYIGMIEADLVGLDDQARGRLRLFTGAPLERIAPQLRACVMPYDDRLEGADSPIRGTRSDFASRALHHFAQAIAVPDDRRSEAEHADAVRRATQGWQAPARVARARHDDESLRALLHQHWEAAGGSSSRLLRLFRDQLHIACEQGRFATLAREVRTERA